MLFESSVKLTDTFGVDSAFGVKKCKIFRQWWSGRHGPFPGRRGLAYPVIFDPGQGHGGGHKGVFSALFLPCDYRQGAAFFRERNSGYVGTVGGIAGRAMEPCDVLRKVEKLHYRHGARRANPNCLAGVVSTVGIHIFL